MPETQNLSSAVAVAPFHSDADILSYLRDCAIAESYARFRSASGQPTSVAIPATAAARRPGPRGRGVVATSLPGAARLRSGVTALFTRPPLDAGHRHDQRREPRSPAHPDGLERAGLAAQRDALDYIDGVEIKAATVDGRRLTLFVPATEKPEQGCLALMSPSYPGVGDWLSPDVAPLDDGNTTGLIAGRVRPTGAVLTIDGLPRAVPLVVADGVQDHLGPTAVLVSAATPNVDGDLVARLAGSAPAWSASQKRIRSRNSTRFRIPTVPISGPGAVSEVPVPVVRCGDCGAVPVPADMLPILRDSPMQLDCPNCGAPARRDEESLVFGPGGRLPWLAAERPAEAVLIAGPHGRDTTLADRAMAKALRDLEPSRCHNGEPYSVNLATGIIAGQARASDLDSDALRFALLYAAAPTTSFTWQPVDHEQCAQFLDHLGEYAIPRLTAASGALPLNAIDDSAPRRRKLIAWCTTARERISENMAALQTHRATRNTMILLERIKAFEQRSAVTTPGNAADAAATASALALLVRLAEPLAPQAMSAIWESAGGDGPLSEQPWPG